MIRISGSGFFINEPDSTTATRVPEAGLYLFLAMYLQSGGVSDNEASLQEECVGHPKGVRFALPSYRADELVGGAGDNAYCQLIDALENKVIEYLSALNPGLAFDKVSITQ